MPHKGLKHLSYVLCEPLKNRNFRGFLRLLVLLFGQNNVKFVGNSKIGNMTHFSFRHAKFTSRGCVSIIHCCVFLGPAFFERFGDKSKYVSLNRYFWPFFTFMFMEYLINSCVERHQNHNGR